MAQQQVSRLHSVQRIISNLHHKYFMLYLLLFNLQDYVVSYLCWVCQLQDQNSVAAATAMCFKILLT